MCIIITLTQYLPWLQTYTITNFIALLCFQIIYFDNLLAFLVVNIYILYFSHVIVNIRM